MGALILTALSVQWPAGGSQSGRPAQEGACDMLGRHVPWPLLSHRDTPGHFRWQLPGNKRCSQEMLKPWGLWFTVTSSSRDLKKGILCSGSPAFLI